MSLDLRLRVEEEKWRERRTALTVRRSFQIARSSTLDTGQFSTLKERTSLSGEPLLFRCLEVLLVKLTSISSLLSPAQSLSPIPLQPTLTSLNLASRQLSPSLPTLETLFFLLELSTFPLQQRLTFSTAVSRLKSSESSSDRRWSTRRTSGLKEGGESIDEDWVFLRNHFRMGGSLEKSLESQVSERERKEQWERSRWIREVVSVSILLVVLSVPA